MGGHDDNEKTDERFEKYVPGNKGGGENVSMGPHTALGSVVDLLIDDGFTDENGEISRGHRDCIMNEAYTHVVFGVAHYPEDSKHFTFHRFVVQNFAILPKAK